MIEFAKVGVLMGGWSSERVISLQSGAAVLSALQASEIDAIAYDLTPQTVSGLASAPFDCAFIVIHGRSGEDGSLQGMLEMLNIPYTGSGILASALAMDKIISKRIWLAQGLPTPPFVVVDQYTDITDIGTVTDFPFALKPICEGSSIGVSKVARQSDFNDAKIATLQVSAAMFAETWITGEEYAVTILEDQVLPPIRLQPARGFYDYRAKYEDRATRYHCPCGLPDDDIEKLERLCMRACRALGVKGWGRVDVMRDQAGEFWLLEVNTVPGLTAHSLVPMSAKASGIDFNRLVLKILATTTGPL